MSALPVVGVVGAGLMGHGIAQVFAVAGAEVHIWDPSEQARAMVHERVTGHLAITGSNPDAVNRIAVEETLAAAVADADLVIEAVPESLAIKRDLMSELDALAPRALVATNTSVLRISEIAAGSRDPGRVIGAHWWNPPYLIDIVELVPGELTLPQTRDTVRAWLRAVGKTPVDVAFDTPGFIGNRMQFALVREALALVSEGIADPATIDLVARETFGRRLSTIGPLANSDFIGLDLVAAILDYLAPHLDAGRSAPTIVTQAIADGRSGARAGAGLLDWPEGERDSLEGRLLKALAQQSRASRDM